MSYLSVSPRHMSGKANGSIVDHVAHFVFTWNFPNCPALLKKCFHRFLLSTSFRLATVLTNFNVLTYHLHAILFLRR